MKKSGVISVIIPVYGVEKYLEDCIESITGQTYKDLEVILVDDGSPDRCGEICDRYARMDSRIVAVHQKNSGAAAARNTGLRMATGEYVTFVDSDDYLEPDAYENLVKAMADHDADISQGEMNFIDVNGRETIDGHKETTVYSATEYLARFPEDWSCALSTVKLFRHHTLTDVFYEEGHCIDDEFFTYRGVMNARKIVCIPQVIYNYRQRASSVMKNQDTREKKSRDVFEFLEKRLGDVTTRFPELKTLYENHYADYLMWLATSDLATKNTVRQIKKRLIRHAASGKALFWKSGQRKRALWILAFVVTPIKLPQAMKTEVKDSGYEFFK